jgi:hypothetical protein
MGLRAVERAARVLLLASVLVFLVVLFLDWHRTSVRVAVAADVSAASSGWSGWGLLAGFFALALVGFELDDRFRRRAPRRERALVDQVLATGLALATVAAVFTGDASVSAGAVGVEVARTLWPAWTGLALAAVVVFAAFVAAVADAEAGEPRPTAGSASRNPS